ncbi:peptide-methionine (R)-S-oxide reductase MsrB [Nitrosomonadales bacterium]|jgi:peptide-methionine (R)-S-oxide reductase|nr:peptide-methionine (R)-S-oxide reductase MsrB [Methylophilaceae bacterium]MDA9600666.1 peptide-methionine (R)-S-oxide reductase MsrB [Nitrosomonadales bacterium]
MLTWKKIEDFVKNGVPAPENKVIKTEEEWRKLLSDDVFFITRQSGTEHAFSSEMCSRFEPGVYACVCCGTLLFDASEKFDSQSGWPSFTQPLIENAIAYTADTTHMMTRIEVTCNCCNAHLGHVFPDGPEPSGLRYCINSLSLKRE